MSTQTTRLVTHTDFVTVPTQDLDAAREFYGTVIGLEAGPVYQPPGKPALGAEFETGNLTLSVVHCESVGIEFESTKVPIAFRVADIEAARNELETRGVTFVAPTMDTGVCHMAHFKDPDGNVLMLHQRYPGRD